MIRPKSSRVIPSSISPNKAENTDKIEQLYKDHKSTQWSRRLHSSQKILILFLLVLLVLVGSSTRGTSGGRLRSHHHTSTPQVFEVFHKPALTHINMNRSAHRILKPSRRAVTFEEPTEDWSRKSCKPVYFLGGQKTGSTTLATLLKHKGPTFEAWDPDGQFSDGGKEICWAGSKKPSKSYWKNFRQCVPDNMFDSSMKTLFALDGCPNQISDSSLKTIAQVHPNAKFLMLVRDPVDRIISHVNAAHIRGGKKHYRPGQNVDDEYKKFLKSSGDLIVRLSSYDQIITTFLKYFDSDQLLIIETLSLKEKPQQVLDEVMEYLGGDRIIVEKAIETNNNKQKKEYNKPSDSLMHELDVKFQPVRDFVQEIVESELAEFRNIKISNKLDLSRY